MKKYIFYIFLSVGCLADDGKQVYEQAIKHVHNGDSEQALSMLLDLTETHPNKSVVYSAIGHIYLKDRNFEKSEKNYRMALSFADDQSSLMGLAMSLLGQEKYDELKIISPQLMEVKNQSSAIAAILLGVAESNNDRFMFFEVLHELNPDYLKLPAIIEAISKAAYLLANKDKNE